MIVMFQCALTRLTFCGLGGALTLSCLLSAKLIVAATGVAGSRTPLAGEIGFSVGRVYTSLSGWTGERTTEAHGTSQLVLLGLWLEQR